MKIITKDVGNIVRYIVEERGLPKGFSKRFGHRQIGFFDIETLGLSPRRDPVILAGLIKADLYQGTGEEFLFYAEEIYEEKELIELVFEGLEEMDMLVTYNGGSFDIPFMKTRAERHSMASGAVPWNLDIYKLIKKCPSIKDKVINLKQKTLENYLGLWQFREDTIGGGEIFDLYTGEYGSPEEKDRAEEAILLHNSDDIEQLCRLITVTGEIDVEEGLFHYGFPVWGAGIVEKTEIKGKGEQSRISVRGRQWSDPMRWVSFQEPVPFEMDEEGGFTFSAPLHEECDVIFADMYELGFSDKDIGDIEGDDVDIYEGCLVLQEGDRMMYGHCNALTELLTRKILDI